MKIGHYINLKWNGPTNCRAGYWRAAWDGMPSQDFRKVSKRISADLEYNAAAESAVAEFMKWINGINAAENHRFRLELIESIIASQSHSEYAIIIKTKGVAA